MTLRGEGKEALRKVLKEIGFDEVRFAELDPPIANRLSEWVEKGYHADMDWLARSVEKRIDPNRVMESAHSIIMLGTNYWPSDPAAGAQSRWAKYTLYRDYHDTIIRGLKKAGSILEAHLGLTESDYRYYVDTGPVMERGWAAASGMGWQGKNGMLISKRHGNWLFLSAILIKARIEKDPPLRKGSADQSNSPELGAHCGKCTRCINVCPTEAIVEPGIVDSRRCISYQTIENKGVIPRWIRPGIGQRIYGCDICLDVCPWNRFAKSGRHLLLESRYGITDLTLLDVLTMKIDSFREIFRKSPIKRLKLRGLLRNGCVVAGNLNSDSEWRQNLSPDWRTPVRDALLDLVAHEEAVVPPHAIWALYRLFGSSIREDVKPLIEESGNQLAIDEFSWWERQSREEPECP